MIGGMVNRAKSGRPHVVLALSEEAAGTTEARLLLEAAGRAGVEAREVVWSHVRAVPLEHDAAPVVVIGHTWDYHLRLPAFRSWLDGLRRIGALVHNPLEIVEWNLDKRYLLELAARGVPIPPTVILESGAPVPAPRELVDRLDAEVAVIKPTVSATAWRTKKVSLADRAAVTSAVDGVSTDRGVMVQAFLPAIGRGEWSLVYFGGRYSHAVLKRPEEGDFRVQTDFGGSVQVAEPPPGALELATACLAALPTMPTFARVDCVGTETGFVLMELELIEPDLFLRHHEPAADRLVACVLERSGLPLGGS